MNILSDFKIIQRDADGFGRVRFQKELEGQCAGVVVRVLREDDNTTVVPWTLADRTKDGFSIDLTIPEGGLYRAEARDAGSATVNVNTAYFDWAGLVANACHFGVGDVFIVAGQSNMAAYGRDAAYDPPQLGVHLFANTGKWEIATHPINSSLESLYENADTCSGTSPALSFGRMMQKRLGVPIGLVSAAKGGAPLHFYYPEIGEANLFKALEKKLEEVGKVAGVIWYQGCAETGDKESASQYFDHFYGMVQYWRERFGNIPFATVQLNRHTNDGPLKVQRPWGIVREAQRQAGLTIKDVYVVPAIDLYTTDGIHNASGCNVILGERLANAMLKGWYHKSGVLAPTITKIKKINEKSIVLYFENGVKVIPMDNCADGLNIEDENGLMECTKTYVNEEGLTVVEGERDIVGQAVFHAYWKAKQPCFFIRDVNGGMPMLACYGVQIED